MEYEIKKEVALTLSEYELNSIIASVGTSTDPTNKSYSEVHKMPILVGTEITTLYQNLVKIKNEF